MNQDYPNFLSRVTRIDRAHRNRIHGEFIVRPDGLIVPRTKRLRFGFPWKGLLLSFAVVVCVKAYLIWVLGLDLYQLEIQQLLNGTSFERVAAGILMPDRLSMWVVGQYDALAALIGPLWAEVAATTE